jgi:hypothetical protein
MDIFSAIYLGGIIFAFLAFTVGLAYADHASRQARRAREAATTQITAAQRPAEGQREAA